MSPLLQRIFPHISAIVVFLLISSVYFSPQLQGKMISSSDVIQYSGMASEIKEYKERTGELTLWTNSMFGGMPTYQINTVSAGNNLRYADRTLNLFGPGDAPIGRFFTAMLGFYLLLVILGANPWLGIVGAIAFGLTTNSMILLATGHVTKFKSLVYFPFLVSGILLAFKDKYLWGGLLFALGLGLNLMSNHPQMIYYLFITLLILGVAQFVYSIRENRLASFGKAMATLIIGAIMAFGSAASNLWVTLEYQQDTMRGDGILTKSNEQQNAGIQSSSETKGLSWDYAMGWSNGFIDLFASFIPGVAGGGTSEAQERYENSFRDQSWQNFVNQQRQYPPLYWGALPFTSGPIYFGAAMLMFFIMGLMLVKGPIKWWLGLGVLITFMLSMGKNLEWFNRLFFDYFPLYNKFRTPNSVLTITSFLLPLLGFLGLAQFFSKEIVSKKELTRSLQIAGLTTGGLYLFFALLGSSVLSIAGPNDAAYQQAGLNMNAVFLDRKAYLEGDAWRSFLIVAGSFALLWFYLKEKIKANLVILGLGVITLLDLWTIGQRYLGPDNFQDAQQAITIQPNAADNQILADKDLHFRVFESSNPNWHKSSRASYFHKSLGGYHAAKLQRYQDIIDRHLLKGNQNVFNMLNTKYVIGQGPSASRNAGAYGNAWFVKDIKMVGSANEEIDALNSVGADSVAIIHREFQEYVADLNINQNGNISLTEYEPNHLSYQSNTNSEQLAVFSEVWYGPDKGWNAYLDGEKVEHIRADYLLRALKVPAGQHKIEFRFEPETFLLGQRISLIFSSIILFGVLGFMGYSGFLYYQKVKDLPPVTKAKKPAPKSVKKTVAKASSRKRPTKKKTKKK